MCSAFSAGFPAFLHHFVCGCFAQSGRERQFLYLFFEKFLYGLEVADVGIADKGDGVAVALGSGCSSDAMHIILGIAWHVVVDNGVDVVDVDASRHDVGCHEHVDGSAFEAIHDFVALGLREV